jgi:predicted GNAT family acetyltransferase
VSHPLDRPIWGALTTRQADIALRVGEAVRLKPHYGVFAAAAEASEASRTALNYLDIGPEGLWCLEKDPVDPPPGLLVVHHRAPCVQMIADHVVAPKPEFEVEKLTEEDAPAMLELARMTEPGPFFDHTHRMGDFIGVKAKDLLIAMAGERLRPEGYTEVSGVCTHPDFRGRGYAGGLMRIVAARILARGEVPFLHSYAENVGAIALYEKLGFKMRSPMNLTVLVKPDLGAGVADHAAVGHAIVGHGTVGQRVVGHG